MGKTTEVFGEKGSPAMVEFDWKLTWHVGVVFFLLHSFSSLVSHSSPFSLSLSHLSSQDGELFVQENEISSLFRSAAGDVEHLSHEGPRLERGIQKELYGASHSRLFISASGAQDVPHKGLGNNEKENSRSRLGRDARAREQSNGGDRQARLCSDC